MAPDIIETPGIYSGDEKEQLMQMQRYMMRMADQLNIALESIGGNDLTNEEQQIMQSILMPRGTQATSTAPSVQDDLYQMESLKSLIIKTAKFVQTNLDEYRIALFGENSAASQFGNYKRQTGLNVDITPTGIKQTYSFAEIVKDLRTYEINAKNYIKTGLLRMEDDVPVYGVAIGKDIVTFSVDGTETYTDGNKVAELTADELSFYQNSAKVASYSAAGTTFYQGGVKRLTIGADGVTFYNGNTVLAEMKGTGLKFYNGGEVIFYIENGEIFTAKDMSIGDGKTVKAGEWILDDEGIRHEKTEAGTPHDITTAYGIRFKNGAMELFKNISGTGIAQGFGVVIEHDTTTHGQGIGYDSCIHPDVVDTGMLGNSTYNWQEIWGKYIIYDTLEQSSSRDVKNNILPMEGMGEKLDELQPVTFIYNNDPEERVRAGLIYEDTLPVMPEICTGNEANKAIRYIELIPMLLKEIQDLRKRVKSLEERAEG